MFLVCTGTGVVLYRNAFSFQARSKAKTTVGESIWLNKPTLLPARHSKNRPIREFKMQLEHQKSSSFSKQNNNFAPASHFWVHFFAVSFTRTTTRNFLISRLKEDINKRRQIFLSHFKFVIGQKESDCRRSSFSVALERTCLCGFRQRANTKLL